MIPFHIIYSWFFKSFNIEGEGKIVERLIAEGHQQIMVVKRSWIFALFLFWRPLVILMLSGVSIWIALYSIKHSGIQMTIIWGNIIMDAILLFSSIAYVIHFRSVHKKPHIETDFSELRKEIRLGHEYFISFFNWSLTNQIILGCTIILEIILILTASKSLSGHYPVLLGDMFVMTTEIVFLARYRKKMVDLEMDYNIVVPGKVIFVNQSGVLSDTQTLESEKIKTVKSSFSGFLGSFFNYGNIAILSEGDSLENLGAMHMYFVTHPNEVVAEMEELLRREKAIIPYQGPQKAGQSKTPSSTQIQTPRSQNYSDLKTAQTSIKVGSIVR